MTFKEEQKFAPWVLWLVRGISASLIVLSVYLYIWVDITPWFLLWVIIASLLLPAILIFLLIELPRLRTQIDKTGVHMTFKPFSKKVYKWPDIESAEVIDYGFVGGWGVRLGTKYGTVYNTQGREGLHLKLKTGKQVVIGTQQKSKLERVIGNYL